MRIEDIRFLSSAVPGATPALELAATLYLPDPSAGAATGSTAPDGTRPCEGLPPAKHGALIVGHGAGSRRSRHDEFCRTACEKGFVVLGLDFRGHGDSAGAADGPMELDLHAAAAYLRGLEVVDPQKICYRGSSMGGFYGLKAGSNAGFAAMALLCPATESVILHAIDEQEASGDTEDPARVTSSGQYFPTAGDQAPRWDVPKLREYFEQQDCLSLARLVECPMLLVHARADEVVPFTHTLLLTQALTVDTTLMALAEGTHTTAQHDPAIHRYAVRWLQEQITSCSVHT